jgi:hypothetical protein
VTRHALILGNNLAGLVTGYRLLHRGFHISIIDSQDNVQSTDRLKGSQVPIEGTTPTAPPPLTLNQSPTLILHGFYHATWALLQELPLEWAPQTFQPVCLEFGANDGKIIRIPQPSWFSSIHPLTRMTFFKGLSWSDRWHVINFLEKQWEEDRLSHHHPDNQSVETWLILAKQSERSRSHFWNPLCRFMLNCDLAEASLGSFIEVLTRYWFGQLTNATTYLASIGTLGKLESELRQLLINRGVYIHSSNTRLKIHTDSERIQAVELENRHFTAQAYVSALAPRNLLPLLPERALARYTYFASLGHLREAYGLAIRFTLEDIRLTPRLILHADSFDWLTCQPSPPSHGAETVITCVTLQGSFAQENTEEWLINNARACIQKLFNLSPKQTRESGKFQIIRQTDAFFPCHRGTRSHRPLPQTPIRNFFLVGPWTATNLPGSLESTITSANACAEAVASATYGNRN